MTTTEYDLSPIGVVVSSRFEPEDDNWDSESSRIELIAPYGRQSLLGLTEFSHCIVTFVFHQANWDESRMSRHPRGNGAWPEVGIFAQRAKDRPNRLGITVCRVVEIDEASLIVAGLDAIDGTPVVDIKPWMNEFGPRGTVYQPSWATELMENYW